MTTPKTPKAPTPYTPNLDDRDVNRLMHFAHKPEEIRDTFDLALKGVQCRTCKSPWPCEMIVILRDHDGLNPDGSESESHAWTIEPAA